MVCVSVVVASVRFASDTGGTIVASAMGIVAGYPHAWTWHLWAARIGLLASMIAVVILIMNESSRRVATLIGQSEGDAVVPTWFQGMNPHLADRSPARVLHEDRFEEAGPRVLAAAPAFVGA